MPGMVQLIVFRALQGIGGGALFTTAFAIIADLYPPRERGKFAGVFGSVFGLASVLGPIIGGVLIERLSWHWAFFVNVPVGLMAMWLIYHHMPDYKGDRKRPLDVIGLVLFGSGAALLQPARTATPSAQAAIPSRPESRAESAIGRPSPSSPPRPRRKRRRKPRQKRKPRPTNPSSVR